MAYADARNTNRKLGAGAAVLLVEAGLAVAIVSALTASYAVHRDHNLRTENFPLPQDPPKPPPPAPKQAHKDDTVIDRPDTLVKLPPSNPIDDWSYTPATGNEGTSSLGDAKFPEPEVTQSPPPPPRFTPKRAAPRGNTGKWVTTNDYPTNELRLEHQGRTSYRLLIDASGTVTDCQITATSGFPALDKATCDNLKRRAHFEPATDQTGARTDGSYAGSVSWQIPEE